MQTLQQTHTTRRWILSLLLTLTLVIGLLALAPLTAFAAVTNVAVGGTGVANVNGNSTVAGNSSAGWAWDGTANPKTLTLNNYTGSSGIALSGGTVVITNSADSAGVIAVNVTVDGTGTTLTAQTGTAINARGDVTVSGGATVTGASGETVILLTGTGAPTNVTATAGDARATVKFTAPANDGGAAITGYTATSSPDGKTATGTASPITVSGLTNGTTYTFTVTAANSKGSSEPSEVSNPVTPRSASSGGCDTGAGLMALAILALLGANRSGKGR
ncbi:hypothetical protein FACS1894187_04710 [Synergistales bacterium]|nr:hypothetical protein FACS1894187_04710 [Synergistales bacterium]